MQKLDLLKQYKIGLLGAGNIAEAIISGLLKSDKHLCTRITISDIRQERLVYLKTKYKIKTSLTNTGTVETSNLIILAVKPQQIQELLKEIRSNIRKKQIVISVAAGITTRFISSFLGNIPILRAMPNTPALTGEGMIGLCTGKYASKRHLAAGFQLFSTCGQVVKLDEKYFDSITALSGSGPAYVMYLAEAMINAGVKLGLPAEASRVLVLQTIFGTGKLMLESKDTPDALRQKVTSPGGTTEKAIEYMKINNFINIITEAVSKAKERSVELSK